MSYAETAVYVIFKKWWVLLAQCFRGNGYQDGEKKSLSDWGWNWRAVVYKVRVAAMYKGDKTVQRK